MGGEGGQLTIPHTTVLEDHRPLRAMCRGEKSVVICAGRVVLVAHMVAHMVAQVVWSP